MPVMDGILMAAGLLFAGFGYAIYFRGRYGLVNSFEAGRADERYARRLGLIELVGGCASVLLGAVSLLVGREWFSMAALAVSVTGILAALAVHHLRSMGRSRK